MAAQSPDEGQTLHRALHVRHLIFIAVGGTIASGFYLASGATIALAGPGVIITYLLGGMLTMGVMSCLAELSVHGYTASGFAKYAANMFGPLVGFLTAWNYWLAWIPGLGAEGIAVATYLRTFAIFHPYPIWLIALVIFIVDGAINLVGVLTMGNYEFTLSGIKIGTLCLFAIVGLAGILGIGIPAVGFDQYVSQGGFLPLGAAGIFTSFLLVIYAYTGCELISVGSEESVHPERDVPRALLGSAAIVTAIFVGVISVLLALQSWKVAGTSSSPLIDAMNAIHQGFVAKVITVGLVLASISAIDAAIYVSSRLLFSLSRDGYFPKVFAKLHPTRKVPILATIVCVSAMYICVLLDVVSPNNAFVLLGSVTTLGFLWAWFIIPLMQMMWRRRLGKERVKKLKWKVPLYPITPIFCMACVVLAIIAPLFQNTPGLLGLNGGELPVAAGILWLIIWTVYYKTIGEKLRAKHLAEHPETPDELPAFLKPEAIV
jgi:L-asparagine transporter-like permease